MRIDRPASPSSGERTLAQACVLTLKLRAVPSDPILRASNEAGDTCDDPSEDLLFELLAELGEGNSFLVVDRLEPGRTEDFIQAVIDANGSFVLEYREGRWQHQT
jgi:hypothetical protein